MHGCQEKNLYLGRCSSKVPEMETISCNQHNTGLIEKPFLKRKQALSRVAKHAHCLYSGQYLSRVVMSMLFERKLSIKVKAQVSPVYLGLENGSTNS